MNLPPPPKPTPLPPGAARDRVTVSILGIIKIEGTGIDAVELPTIADPIGFRRAIETAKGMPRA